MAHPKYSTKMAERKKGQHLRMEERGAIKVLESRGWEHEPSQERQDVHRPP